MLKLLNTNQFDNLLAFMFGILHAEHYAPYLNIQSLT